jgi:hypothetical protein
MPTDEIFIRAYKYIRNIIEVQQSTIKTKKLVNPEVLIRGLSNTIISDNGQTNEYKDPNWGLWLAFLEYSGYHS